MSEKLGCPPSYHDNFATTADTLMFAMNGGDDEVLVASIRDAFKFLAPGCDETLVRFRDVLAELARQRAIGQNHPLYRQWEKICTDFQATLWESHKCASKMSARMKSFYKVLGPIVIESALPTDMKLQTVNNFLTACDDNEEQGQALVQRFDNIFTQVNNFEKALQGFLHERHAEIVEQERGTQQAISQLNGEINSLWLKVGVVSVGIAAAVAAFGALIVYKPASLTILNRTIQMPSANEVRPAAAFVAGLHANSGINAFGDLIGKRRDRAAFTARLDGLKAERFSIENTTEKFASMQNSRISEIKHNIECFTNAWQRLNGGCIQLKESLEISRDHVEYPQAFAYSLAGTCELYKAMTECLDAYATGVLTASRFRCR